MKYSLQKIGDGNRVLLRVTEVESNYTDKKDIMAQCEKVGTVITFEKMADGMICYYIKFDSGKVLRIVQGEL